MNSTGEQAAGNDITGTSDAIVLESVPDLALPKESESADSGISQNQCEFSGGPAQRTPLGMIAAAGAAGLLLGIVLKKSLPSVKGRY